MISDFKNNFTRLENNKYFFLSKLKWLIPIILILLIVIGCATLKTMPNPSIKASLQAIGDSADSVGSLIYEGSVFPIEGSNPKQIFSYERRVKEEKDISSATHITRDMTRDVVVTQKAKYSGKYQLQEFEYINGQVGYTAKAEVVGKFIRFKLTDNSGQVTNSEEEVNEPLAVGPTLFGLIAVHWEELSKGSSFFLRFVVAEQKQSYRFEVRKVSDNGGITRFEMKATSWIIGLFIAPFQFDYDSAKRTIITYQGRVPPMLMVDGKLKELDARVSYTHKAAYR